ncbi:MAG: tRNA-dihydrouridine synthase, partial [Gammaproteobacteria bacterium]|nr:tRNA-dihydrouridine synthase [Gammaproteobacteria bacterium]
QAEYDTIAAVKSSVSIPVIANGDITSPQKAKTVLHYTGADGLMIGRTAQGNPWIFKQIKHYLAEGSIMPPPGNNEISKVLVQHLRNLYDFYGEYSGVRIARKHIGWYIKAASFDNIEATQSFQKHINQVDNSDTQINLVDEFFNLQTHSIAA